jgi:hypothetical protein
VAGQTFVAFAPNLSQNPCTVCYHDSTSDAAAKALHMLHMGPISEVPMINHVWAASVCQAMALLQVWLVANFCCFCTQSEPKSMYITAHLML